MTPIARLTLVLVLTLSSAAFANSNRAKPNQRAKPRQPATETERRVPNKTAAAPAAARPAGAKGQVLDFEADVIEGEGKKPDVLLDFSTEAATLDSIVYRRGDFNDQLQDHSKGRVRHQNPTSGP